MRLQDIISHSILVTVVVAMGVRAAQDNFPGQKRVPKQIHTNAKVVDTEEDHKSAESHFGGGGAGIGGHGKYFMYQHIPHDDHYEFGFRRGNEHHFKERYEKAAPHHGHFKTKARWGDKHGGYGEHYWDYNHDGHGGHGDDDGGGHSDEGGDGGYSEPVPDYQQAAKTGKDDRVKRQHPDTATASTSSTSGSEPVPGLVYDVESGTVVNEATGQRYLLTPIN